NRVGIGQRIVLVCASVLEAASMQCDLEPLYAVRLGFVGWKFGNGRWQGNCLRHDAGGIVVPFHCKYWNVRAGKTCHLAVEDQADRIVPPLAVVDVSRDYGKSHSRFDGLRHKIGESLSARGGKSARHVFVFESKSTQWTTEMKVGSVQKREIHAAFLMSG